MTEDERLQLLVREALRPAAVPGPSRDLWPLVVKRIRASAPWSWLDLSLAAALAIALLMRPSWLWFVVCHL